MDGRHLVDKDVETSRVDIGTLFWSIAGKMQTEPLISSHRCQDNKILKVSADPFKITTGTVQRLTGVYSCMMGTTMWPNVAEFCTLLLGTGYHLWHVWFSSEVATLGVSLVRGAEKLLFNLDSVSVCLPGQGGCAICKVHDNRPQTCLLGAAQNHED